MPIIEVENLTKSFLREKRQPGLLAAAKSLIHREYETKIAVDSISFSVEKGEIVGYIGPNGAGKSTTIKMMVGILVPTSGKVEVNGLVPYKNRIENAQRMGVVFGQRTQLWWDIPVLESFNLMKYMYKISEKQYKEKIKRFSDILGIDEFMHVPVRQLSLGQRMRADLCAALLHNPGILFLDEPTIGLDVVVKENIRQFVKEINNDYDTTVILTTHDIADIEKLSSRVIVIDQGKIMYDGNLTQLKNLYGTEAEITIETETPISRSENFSDLELINIEHNANKIIIKYNTKYTSSSQIIERMISKYKLKDFVVKETEIEDIIRKMYLKEVVGHVNQRGL